MMNGCLKMLFCALAVVRVVRGSVYSCYDGSWRGTGVSTDECFAVCLDGSSTYVFFASNGDSYPSDRSSVTYNSGTGAFDFTYTENESGGQTTNTEDWTYASTHSTLSGTNSWSWTDGSNTETGTSTFTGSQTYACTKYAAGSPTYKGIWTVATSTDSSDIGTVTEVTFQIKQSGTSPAYIEWIDGSTTSLTWDECQKTITFSYTESESGGTTTTNEIWTRTSSGGWTATSSTWNWASSSDASISSGTNYVNILSTSSDSDSDSGMSAGAVAGIVVCVIFVFALSLTLVLYCYNKSKMSRGRPIAVKYPSAEAPSYNTNSVPTATAVGVGDHHDVPVAHVFANRGY